MRTSWSDSSLPCSFISFILPLSPLFHFLVLLLCCRSGSLKVVDVFAPRIQLWTQGCSPALAPCPGLCTWWGKARQAPDSLVKLIFLTPYSHHHHWTVRLCLLFLCNWQMKSFAQYRMLCFSVSIHCTVALLGMFRLVLRVASQGSGRFYLNCCYNVQ